LRFEHILQVYWSKGFFYGGKLFYTNKLKYKDIFNFHLYGLGKKFKYLLTTRLELTTFNIFYVNTFFLLKYLSLNHKNLIKTINIIFSQVNNVNATSLELTKLNIVRKYLTKSYQGYCHAIGKPVRGQRTWSNSWNSFKCNNVLRNFITKTKHLNSINDKSRVMKINYKAVKKKYITSTSSSSKLASTTTSDKNNFTKTFLTRKSWY
jgi:ribosomal protein S13